MRSATQPPPPQPPPPRPPQPQIQPPPPQPPPPQPRPQQPQQPRPQPVYQAANPKPAKAGPIKRATATFIYVMAVLCIVAVVVTLYRNQGVTIGTDGVTTSGGTQAATGTDADQVPASEIRAGQTQLNVRLDEIERQIQVSQTSQSDSPSALPPITSQVTAPPFGGTWQSGAFTYEITQVGDVASIVESSNGLITAVGEGAIFDGRLDLVYEDAFGNIGVGSLTLDTENSISGSFTSVFTVPVSMQRIA